jgi:HSF-type DNA-binding
MAFEPPGKSEQIRSQNQTTRGESTEHHFLPAASTLYHDHSLSVPPAGESVSENEDSKRFPEKLFRLLGRAELESFNHIISWQPHGRCFVVHLREAFIGLLPVLMPGLTRWKSFQRQLHLWGFTRLTEGRDIRGYYHEMFLRHRPHLLCHMRRGHYGDRTRVVATNPDFYAMPFLTPLESVNINRGFAGASSSVSTRLGFSATSPLDQSETISLSGPSANSGVNLLDLSYGSSIGASAASLAAIEDILGESLDQRRGALGDTANGNLDRSVVSPRDSTTVREGQWRNSHDGVADLCPELEPRPLPPVQIREGETVIHSYAPIPVAQHPGFEQTGPQEFSFRKKAVDESEQ